MGYSIYPAPSAAAKIQKTTVITSTQSWTVPADVTQIELLMCGGGAGGNYINNAGGNQVMYGGPGSAEYFPSIAVTPGSTHTITIGAGGAQANANTPGLPPSGGTSSFGSLATVNGGMSIGAFSTGYGGESMFSGTPGGRGGYPAVMSYSQGSSYFTNDASTAGLMGYGGAGAHSINGNNEHGKFSISGGGGGGYNYYNGSAYVAVAGGNGLANTGGGGGAGYSGSGIWSNAGNGGSGICIIKYWSAL